MSTHVNDDTRMAELYTERAEGKRHEYKGNAGDWYDKTNGCFDPLTEYRLTLPTYHEAVDAGIEDRLKGYGLWDEQESLFRAGMEYGKLAAERASDDK